MPYTDPFPPAAAPGILSYSQPSGSVILNENLSGVALPITRAMQNVSQGLKAISIEWWMKQKPQGSPLTSNPDGTILHGPGFAVTADWQWGGGSGSIIVNLFQNFGGQFLGHRGIVIPLAPSDEQWHHYAITYDLRTVRSYVDGELIEQKWIDNSTDRLGPYEDDSFTIRTSVIEIGGGVTTSGRRFQNGSLQGMRVSNVCLTPWQVKRNFENARIYTKTIHVAPNGSGNGSQASPMSLAAAMAQVGPSTRIVLQGGTYSGADFQITGSGTSPRDHCLIIGADGSVPAVIAGSTPTLNGAGHISLRNLTFTSGGDALQVHNAVRPVTVDACRFSAGNRGLVFAGSSKPMVQNSLINAPTGIYLLNSSNACLRQNTIIDGSVGIQFDGSSSWITMLNNLFHGQTTASVMINNTSHQHYRGNGNLYSPIGAAMIINGQSFSAAQVNNKQLANAWYAFDTQDVADNRQRRTGYSGECNSMAFVPTFVDAANGDFRLAAVHANAIDAGAERTFQHGSLISEGVRRGCIPPVSDATGAPRVQGNGVDVGAFESVPLNYAVFNLNAEYTCSAGVYKNDGTLVRTLFSGQRRAAGTNVVYWNGLDDHRQPVPAGTYTIKMIAHNVQYVWEGVVGNTSSPNANSSVHGGFEPVWGLTIHGSTVFYTGGYNENKYELYRFDTSNPNKVTKSFGPIHNIYSDAALDVAADASKLYSLNSAQVAIYNVSDCNPTTFGNGQSRINVGSGRGYVEVQPNGNLLFVSRRDQNTIYILDKTTGNQTGTIAVNQPKDMALAANGELWVLSGNDVIRFAVNSAGGYPVQVITGLGNAVNIACSPVDGTLIVADSSTHQVKAFTASGTPAWTLGQPNGYANAPRVTHDKFYFLHVDQGRYTYMAPLAFQPDGSFWVCDTFMSRMLHFSPSLQLLHQVTYQPHSYNASVDANNPTRVFNRFTEYTVDYSKPLEQSWVITNFWGFNLPSYMYGFEDGPWSVVTLANGRTYGLIYDGSPGSGRQIVELTATGLRETSVKNLYIYTRIEKDGSIITSSLSGNTVTFYKKPLNGFNAAGDPQWGSGTVLGSAPVNHNFLKSDPYSWKHPQLSSNLIISYDTERTRSGFHLGAVRQGSSDWLWKALPTAGGVDGYGTFDTWCEYGGSHVMTSGRHIIAGFHGEFFQDIGQANQFYHYFDNGLFIGQFGSPMVNGVSINGPGAAGNNFAPNLVEVGGSVYLYHNDEWSRGSHRWKPTGLNAIQELSSSVFQGQAPGATNQPGAGTNTNLVGSADLVVTAVSVSPANPKSGDQVRFIGTIKNQGGVPSSATTLGCAFYVNGSKVTWWFEAGASLAPGESRTVTAFDGFNSNLGVWVATSGVHSITGVVDDADRVLEGDEANNRFTTSFTVSAATPLPTVTIAATSAASEPNANGAFTVTRSGATTSPLVVYLGVSGSATSGSDYQPLNSITIPAGASSAQVLIRPIDDATAEPDESVSVTISPNAGYTVGSSATANINIADNDSAGIVKVRIKPGANRKMLLEWDAQIGSTYRVSYRNSLTDSWNALTSDMTATASVLAHLDSPPGNVEMRFYKVEKR